jgi:hypothetical protein
MKQVFMYMISTQHILLIINFFAERGLTNFSPSRTNGPKQPHADRGP